MKTRDVVGKSIVAIRQGWIEANYGRAWAVEAIVLDDGSELRFVTIELNSDYATDVVVARRKKLQK